MSGKQCVPVKKTLRIEQVVGEETVQAIVRDTIVVPVQKPPAVQVLDWIATPEVTKITVITGKVIIEGVIHLKVVYEGRTPAQTVHVVEADIPFKHFVEIPEAFPEAEAFVNVAVEDMSFTVQADGRQIIVEAVLSIKVKVVNVVQLEVVVDAKLPPGAKIERETITVDEVIAEKSKQAIVQGVIEVPPEKPPVQQVLGQQTTVEITSQRVIVNKVIFGGVLNTKVMYEGRVPAQTVHVVHGTIPFKEFVEVPGAEPGMDVSISASVEHVSFEVSPDGRRLTVRVVLMITAKVVRPREVSVVTNVTGVEGIILEKKLVRIEEVIGEDREQALGTQTIEVPPEKPCVRQVIDYVATATVTRKEILPNKVLVSITVHLKLIYEGEEPSQAVHVIETDVPFQVMVEIPGAKPDHRVTVDVTIESVTFDVLPRLPEERCGRVKAQVIIGVFAKVVATKQIEVVVDLECPDVEGICVGIVTGNLVNVRSGPGTTFPVITQLNMGDRVVILAYEGDWTRVRLSTGQEAYIFGKFVQCEEPPMG